MSRPNSYNYIFDVSAPQKVQILSEGVSPATGEPKVVFKAVLQAASIRLRQDCKYHFIE